MPKPPKLSKKALKQLKKAALAEASVTIPEAPEPPEPEIILPAPETVHHAAPQILAALSDSLGWGLGALWNVDRETDRLQCVSVWHAEGIDATEFEAVSRTKTFAIGSGIPGRAWAEGGPIWIEDVAGMGRSDRIRNTAAIGLHAAFAMPIVLEGGALGVIEFFSRTPRQPDAALLKLMGAVGTQLAQFMHRIQIESDAHLSEQRFNALADGPVGMWHAGPGGETLYTNPAMCHMLGVDDPAELTGATIGDFVDPTEIQPEQSSELALTGRDGSRRTVIMSEAPLETTRGLTGGTVRTFVDVTELREVTDRLDFLSRNDPLTELPNHAMFTEHLELALHRGERYGTATAVIFIDIDEFSLVNEGLGRTVGDELLRKVAERLRAVTRKADVVGRQAGDEFLVLLADIATGEGDDAKQRDAAQLAESVAGHIRHALQTPFTIDGHEVYIGISTGVAVHPTHGDDAETLLTESAAAMTAARTEGRGGGVAARRAPTDQLRLTARLRQAVANGEFVLHYQPVCDMARGLVIGVEALIRWNDGERGLIGPSEFIPLAERTGMISQISDWLVAEACRQSRVWRDEGVRVGVSLNLPPILWQPSMADHLRSSVSEAGLRPNEFMIEITESAIMTNPDRSQEILQELARDGFRLAIDDFGTGYSSLARLRHMPVSALKIDRSFIAEVPDNRDAATIVTTIIQLAKNLGLVALAEGIETQEQLDWLIANGCALGQGYLLERPVPGDQIPGVYRAFEKKISA